MKSQHEFEAVVAQTLDDLPRDLARHIANVAIVVEEIPDDDTLDAADVDDPLTLLGFYHGIPLTERTHDYGLVPPDKISIYRQPILASCLDDNAVRACIRRTVLHELAHYFGIDDDRLEELGAY
ncbi:MAG: metallopeptidase family protein [Chloroflexi bacterium]|nr:metallopeptidase family protein [Chloroflexota bacterium]